MIFTINAALLQKLKNKISPHAFFMRAIPPVFNQVKLADYGSKNALRRNYLVSFVKKLAKNLQLTIIANNFSGFIF